MVKLTSPAYQKAIQSLWDGNCTIIVRDMTLDPTTGRTEPQERVAAENIPCRVSYTTVKSAETTEEAATVAQSVTLYLDPAVDIPVGSKITVTQNGVTRDTPAAANRRYTPTTKKCRWSFGRSGPDELGKL